jgi:hypothetical protein
MPNPNAPDETPEPIEPAEDLAYDTPDELADDEDGGGRGRAPTSIALKLAAVAAVVLVAGAALLAYRAQHRKNVVAAALSQADALLRLDTAAGYRQAATLLEPIAQLDPMQGASVRAFALAMLFAVYRLAGAVAVIENLLVIPGRADTVPAYAQLATAALALGRKEAGAATVSVVRAGDGQWPLAMQARGALHARDGEAARPPAAGAAAEARFRPGSRCTVTPCGGSGRILPPRAPRTRRRSPHRLSSPAPPTGSRSSPSPATCPGRRRRPR